MKLTALLNALTAVARDDLNRFTEINPKCELEMEFSTMPGLCDRFGPAFPQL